MLLQFLIENTYWNCQPGLPKDPPIQQIATTEHPVGGRQRSRVCLNAGLLWYLYRTEPPAVGSPTGQYGT
jgi:hypothetical protein